MPSITDIDYSSMVIDLVQQYEIIHNGEIGICIADYLRTKGFNDLSSDAITSVVTNFNSTVDDLAKQGSLKIVEYTLPSMPYRIKKIIFHAQAKVGVKMWIQPRTH